MTSHLNQFRDAMAAVGLRTDDEIIDDGILHRFHIDGDKPRTHNGWYTLHGDGIPAGAFGSWKHDIAGTWCTKSENEFTPDERKSYAKRMDEAKRQREAEQHRIRDEARAKAADIWAQSAPANDNHPYLVRKQIKAHGLRESRGKLVLPMYSSDGTLQSLQFIDDEGNKRFLSGGQKRGCYFGIGAKPVDRLIVVEGFATGASICQATGAPVAIAFDAGNLDPVCEALRLKLPSTIAIEIWADNDRIQKCRHCQAEFDLELHPEICPECGAEHKAKNVGIEKASKVGEKIGATVVSPEDGGDFNDMAVSQGLEAVAAVAPPANDNLPPSAQMIRMALPDVSPKGKPYSTIENLARLCDYLRINIRYNVISKEEEILIPGQSFSVDNQANATLAWLMSWCARVQMPTDKVGDFVTYLADKNLYNPVAEWITSKPWDRQSRLQDLFDTIDATDNELKCVLMKRWMLSAVAAAFNHDGVSAHGVLTLQGDQYLGKTKWFKSLVPDDLGLVKDGMLLQPHDKDSVKQVCSFWLVELGELDATFRKSDIAALKSFITNKSDVLRRAYARRESHFARRTVFFASVNPKQFLHDATGNRRYWTIEAKWIDHSHNLDMQQVWAEVLCLYNSGEGYYLLPDEMDGLNKANEEFTVIDPIHERLSSRLQWNLPQHEWTWRSATDIMIEIGLDKPTSSDVTKAATFIRSKNGNQGKRTPNARLLLAPPHFGVNNW